MDRDSFEKYNITFIEETELYTLGVNYDLDEVYVCMKDEKKQLLMNMVTDIGEDIICELAVAIEKIEAGTLPSYGLALNAYAFHVNADRISIEEFAYGPGSEYATNSFDELKELLDLYCGLYYKIYGIDLKVIDENYWPLVEGIIDDYPAKEEVRKQLRFPDE